jgi:rubredoxin-NAD+ reductase
MRMRHDQHCAPRPGVLIVGAGRAGWQLAEALRGHDADLPITIVTACAGDVYDKPLLSVALARQIAPEKLVKETGAEAAQR